MTSHFSLHLRLLILREQCILLNVGLDKDI